MSSGVPDAHGPGGPAPQPADPWSWAPPSAGQSPPPAGQSPSRPGQWPQPSGQWPPPPNAPAQQQWWPAPPPPAGSRTDWGRLALRAVAVFAAIGLVTLATAAGWLVGPDRVVFPETWDPQVREYVAFVEDTRGLPFEHPVRVNFLSVDEYERVARGDDIVDSGDADDAAASADELSLYRALGLVAGDVDLDEAFDDLAGSGSLAYYDTVEKVVNVRGTELTVDVGVTLVHELTHALQDQHFDIESGFSLTDPDMYRSIVEGDAISVENRFVDTLDEEELSEYTESATTASDEALDQLDEEGVPPALTALFGSYYDLGGPFVEIVIAREGYRGVDRLLEEPPWNSSPLVTPEFLIRDTPLDDAYMDEFPDEPLIEEGTFGAVWTYLTLAARIDPQEALEIVDNLVGDWYALYESDSGVPCLDVAMVPEHGRDIDGIVAGFEKWAHEMPAEARTRVREVNGEVVFSTCDPGPEVEADVNDAVETASSLPATRLFFIAEALGAGATDEEALCAGSSVAAELPLDIWSLAADDVVDDAGGEGAERTAEELVSGTFEEAMSDCDAN